VFATILGLSANALGFIIAVLLILWCLKDVFKAANGPVSRGLWDLFRRIR
jgi:hypothetical protein